MIAIGLLTCLVLAPPASTVEFDGEIYTAQYRSNQPNFRLVEFVRETETVENWTRLFAVRNFPRHSDPAAAVKVFERTVKEHNPLAGVRVLVKEDRTEAMIDFLTWQQGDETMEFNIHRYLRKPGQPGLISYQFAYRFKYNPEITAEQIRALRERWTDEMTKVNPPLAFGE